MQLVDKEKLYQAFYKFFNSDDIIKVLDKLDVIEIPQSTIRDDIAIKAMVAMIGYGETEGRNPKYLSDKSYAIADAMLNKRKTK